MNRVESDTNNFVQINAQKMGFGKTILSLLMGCISAVILQEKEKVIWYAAAPNLKAQAVSDWKLLCSWFDCRYKTEFAMAFVPYAGACKSPESFGAKEMYFWASSTGQSECRPSGNAIGFLPTSMRKSERPAWVSNWLDSHRIHAFVCENLVFVQDEYKSSQYDLCLGEFYLLSLFGLTDRANYIETGGQLKLNVGTEQPKKAKV